MLSALIRFINERHGTDFELGGRYAMGEQGAFAITEGIGDGARRFVLKWERGTDLTDDLRDVVAVTERLCAVGYPAPRYRLVGFAPQLGVVYSIQEALFGLPRWEGGWTDRSSTGCWR